MLLYDSLNLVISAFISELLGARFRINEVESAAEVGLCYMHNAAVRCLLSSTSAKNYHNRIVCLKIIPSRRWTFLRHSVEKKLVCPTGNQIHKDVTEILTLL